MPLVDQPRKANYNDRLADYVDVKERVRLFYERHPDGRLVTAELYMSPDPDGNVRVWGKALAYRTPDDTLPGVGWSYMLIPGTTPYTRGSEAENVETSAWGRAIGALGIGIDKSIASVDEIQSKEGEPVHVPAPERTTDGGLIGIAEVGTATDSDFNFRDGSTQADGRHRLGFRLKANGRGGIKVIARDDMAVALAGAKAETIGQRVTCWGRISDETFRPKGAKRDVTYQVLQLERIQTPEFVFPSDVVAPEPSGEPVAPLLPLDEDEKAAIAAGLPE